MDSISQLLILAAAAGVQITIGPMPQFAGKVQIVASTGDGGFGCKVSVKHLDIPCEQSLIVKLFDELALITINPKLKTVLAEWRAGEAISGRGAE